MTDSRCRKIENWKWEGWDDLLWISIFSFFSDFRIPNSDFRKVCPPINNELK